METDWDSLSKNVQNSITDMKTGVNKAWSDLKGELGTTVDGIKTDVMQKFNTLKTDLTTTTDNIKTSLINSWNNVKGELSSTVDKIKTDLIAKWKALGTGLSAEMDIITRQLDSKMNNMKSSLQSKMNSIKNVFNNSWKGIGSNVSSIVGQMVNGVNNKMNSLSNVGVNAVSRMRTSMESQFRSCASSAQSSANSIKRAFEGMHISIPRPKIPYITASYQSYSYGNGGNVSVPRFSVSWYANGGFFNGASIIGVGEAGREAVLPLENKRNMKPYAQAVASLMSDMTGGNGGTYNINITQNNTINSELDIKKVSQELARETERECRRRGLTPRTNR